MQKKKFKIGYTTGTFDLFHVGHLNILEKAKENCEYLVVGVSTDELVKEYKGEFPIIPFEDRLRIVKSLKCVDQVIPQKTMNKLEVLTEINYNVLFHGDDWKNTKMYNEIEEKLKKELNIPVFHDDQHGTAVVVLAALYNALRVTKKDIKDITVVLNGPGAAGTAIIKMMHTAGVGKIIAVDDFGILYKDRQEGLIPHKRALCDITNPDNMQGTLADALKGADVFVGVSKPNLVTDEMVHSMNNDPIIFAMANPEPEITYQKAKAAGARVVGTGRSDYPNQINNVLAFPGIFKGALEARVPSITPEMKVAVAKAIADTISDEDLNEENIMPKIFNKDVTAAVADAIKQFAK